MNFFLIIRYIFVLLISYIVQVDASESKKSNGEAHYLENEVKTTILRTNSESQDGEFVSGKENIKNKEFMKTEISDRQNVIMETSKGSIIIELWSDKAPATVENFLRYVQDRYYDGLIFHRVINRFMIQGGGLTPDFKKRETRPPIKNEAMPDVKNDRGTLAMARTAVLDSATSQFFINLVDNNFLNQRDKTQQGFGYCVFGKVTKGMDVVDKIGNTKTGARGTFGKDVPIENVMIMSIQISK